MKATASKRALVASALALAAVFAPNGARADDAGAPDAGVPESIGGCVEHLPEGAVRPGLKEEFPTHGTSGYAAVLQVDVEHGKGESVLPRGLEIQAAGESANALRGAQFVVPDQDGGAAARIHVLDAPADRERVTTRLELSVVPLPPEPGRHTLLLPPVPIAVARANGEVVTVCTRPHAIVVEDPTSSTPDARPRPNPAPRSQREEWTSLRNTLAILAAGALLGALLFYVVRRFLARPRPLPPPPPPRPPWESALEKLDEVRHAGLLEQARFGEYFDRVSDAVRGYLGARFGFEGLESTSDEIVAALTTGKTHGDPVPLLEVVAFLRECDLVKFANATPTLAECTSAIDAGEGIVRRTMPAQPRVSGAPPR